MKIRYWFVYLCIIIFCFCVWGIPINAVERNQYVCTACLHKQELNPVQKSISDVDMYANIMECVDFSEMTQYLKIRYDITLCEEVYTYTFESIRETVAGIEYVMQLYPTIQKSITQMTMYDTDDWIAAMSVSGVIYFSDTYYSLAYTEFADKIAQWSDSDVKWHPDNCDSMFSYGMHEAFHFLIVAQMENEGYNAYQILYGWDTIVYRRAQQIVQQCAIGRNLTKAIAAISEYATVDYMETISEAMCDYVINGTESAWLSQKIGRHFTNKFGVSEYVFKTGVYKTPVFCVGCKLLCGVFCLRYGHK